MKLSGIHYAAILALILVCAAIYLDYYSQQATLPLESYYNSENITIYNATAHTESVWVASTETQLQNGMMNRTGFQGKYGMLFVFDYEQPLCFWMKNTEIPLEQSWINSSGYVVEVYEANAYNTTPVCANGEYVLETPANTPLNIGDRLVV